MSNKKNGFINFILFAFVAGSLYSQSVDPTSPKNGWDFKFKDYPIGAWYGPYASDEEVQLYKNAGFNVIMVGRYMNNDNLDLSPAMIDRHLNLAEKFGLNAIFDSYSNYSWSDNPVKNDQHPISLEELQWVYNRFGNHPALVGFLLGDDQLLVTDQLRSTTRYIRENCPHLMPWICQNRDFLATTLLEIGNPIANWQMYASLYNRTTPAADQMQLYCNQLIKLNKLCDRYDLTMWPMFNVVFVYSDGIIRFQVYSSLAYASQGIWYFHYDGGLRGPQWDVPKHVYPDAAKANKRTASWGPLLLGCKSGGVFSTGWKIDEVMEPDSGQLVTEMSDNLLAGILLKDHQYPMAMVVDKRLSNFYHDVDPREITVRFHENISKINVLEGDSIIYSQKGNEISVQIESGEGQLLQLVDPVPNILSAFPSSSGPGKVDLYFNGHHTSYGYRIYYSTNNLGFSDFIYSDKPYCTISNLDNDCLYYFRICAVSQDGEISKPSKTIIASPSPSTKIVLIVDGTNMDYLTQHANVLNNLGYGIASCNHKVIERNIINLSDAKYIDWLIGDRKSGVFSYFLRNSIKKYLEEGGYLVISGENLGYALSENDLPSAKEFYQDIFKSHYLYEAPDKKDSSFFRLEAVAGSIFDGLPLLSFDYGTHGTYGVNSPDVIVKWNGGMEGLYFEGAKRLYKGACIYYSGQFGNGSKTGKLVNLSVPLETIYPYSSRKLLLQRIFNFFDAPASVGEFSNSNLPTETKLFQNYPNPFNQKTRIRFYLFNRAEVKLILFDILGHKVKTLIDDTRNSGFYETELDGSTLSSGIYYYRLYSGEHSHIKKFVLVK